MTLYSWVGSVLQPSSFIVYPGVDAWTAHVRQGGEDSVERVADGYVISVQQFVTIERFPENVGFGSGPVKDWWWDS